MPTNLELLIGAKAFIDSAIFEHQADTISLDPDTYKEALKLSKDIKKKIEQNSSRKQNQHGL